MKAAQDTPAQQEHRSGLRDKARERAQATITQSKRRVAAEKAAEARRLAEVRDEQATLKAQAAERRARRAA